MSTTMASLLSMPTEVLHSILVEVDHTDLASLSRSCHTLHQFIQHDALLWKESYLAAFDAPSRDGNKPEPDWKKKLQNIVTVQKILQSSNSEVKRDNIHWIAEELHDFLQNSPYRNKNPTSETGQWPWNSSPSRNVSLLAQYFCPDRQDNIDNLLCGSSLFQKCGTPAMKPYSTDRECQSAARLHVLYGVPLDLAGKKHATHPFARSRVYDLRYYTEKTRWGPFTPDGTMNIDWENLEATLILLGYNFHVFRERTNGAISDMWNRPFAGIALDAWPIVKEPDPPVEDPYGCHGTWMRVVCFLDYTDLYAFNFSDQSAIHKDPREHPRDALDSEEAIRLITCKLRVTSIERPEPEDGQGLPLVRFQGDSHSMHSGWDPNARSRLKGHVRLMKDGQIRWTSWSIFHGEERWRSECIQVGGIRSGRGILGNWFDKDFDMQGPVGPTAFWKVSDEIVDDAKMVRMPWI